MDRDLLKQAMLNVVVNAMQAMPEGGELLFEATRQRGHRGIAYFRQRARAFRPTCATKFSACTSAPNSKVQESAWP